MEFVCKPLIVFQWKTLHHTSWSHSQVQRVKPTKPSRSTKVSIRLAASRLISPSPPLDTRRRWFAPGNIAPGEPYEPIDPVLHMAGEWTLSPSCPPNARVFALREQTDSGLVACCFFASPLLTFALLTHHRCPALSCPVLLWKCSTLALLSALLSLLFVHSLTRSLA